MSKHYLLTLFILIINIFTLEAAQGVSGMHETEHRVLILLGPPGSGKGTQAARISREMGLPHISTGDLFRHHISNDTELGKKAKVYMNQGQLVPDALVLEMLFERVAEEDCRQGYLLDGFPRTVNQAKELDRKLPNNTRLIAINLEVSDAVVMQRISGRLSCSSCGNIVNRFEAPPKEEGKCDRCGGELYQREDDKPEVVHNRLKVYNEQTAPLIDYYSAKKVLQSIDGERSPDVIFADIDRNLAR